MGAHSTVCIGPRTADNSEAVAEKQLGWPRGDASEASLRWKIVGHASPRRHEIEKWSPDRPDNRAHSRQERDRCFKNPATSSSFVRYLISAVHADSCSSLCSYRKRCTLHGTKRLTRQLQLSIKVPRPSRTFCTCSASIPRVLSETSDNDEAVRHVHMAASATTQPQSGHFGGYSDGFTGWRALESSLSKLPQRHKSAVRRAAQARKRAAEMMFHVWRQSALTFTSVQVEEDTRLGFSCRMVARRR